MPVSPCETLINLRGRWLEGEQPWPHKAEDDGSIYVVWRNAADIPASNKSHMAFQRRPWKRKKKKKNAALCGKKAAVYCMHGMR